MESRTTFLFHCGKVKVKIKKIKSSLVFLVLRSKAINKDKISGLKKYTKNTKEKTKLN
jgi:hypothetical protein